MLNINKKFENLYKSLYPSLDSKIANSLSYYLKYITDENLEKALDGVIPPANRGVSSPNFTCRKQDFKLNCLLDWLTCSFSYSELKKFFVSLGCYDVEFNSFFDDSFRIKTKFYENSFKFLGTGCISTGMIQKGAERSCLLELTGQSIQLFREKFVVSDLELIKKINYTDGNDILKTAVKITRVDLTLDYESLNVFSGLRLWDNILVYLNNKSFSSSLNSSSIKYICSGGNLGHIQSIYLGSMSSNRFMLMYLKHEESLDKRGKYIDNFVVRFELRLSENHAFSFRCNVDQCKNDIDFFNLIRSTINDFIEFKESNNLDINLNHRNRLLIAEFWKEIFKTDIEINSFPVYKCVDLYRKKKYAENCALTLFTLREVDERLYEKILVLGKEKFEEKLNKNLEILEICKEQYNIEKGEVFNYEY